MTKALQANLERVFAREDFQREVSSAHTMEDVFDLLHKNGIDLSDDDIDYCMDQAETVMKENGYLTEDGELSEEMLEIVSGGGLGNSIGYLLLGGAIVWGGAKYIAAGKAGIAGYTACMAIGGPVCVLGGALIVAGAIGIGIAIYNKKKKKRK